MGLGLITAGIGAIGSRKNNKKLNKLLKNAPKYKISDETFENPSIARSRAYGPDRGIQMQMEDLNQSVANAVSEAKDVTSGTSSLLSTIAALQANRDNAMRSFAEMESERRDAKFADLYAANNAVVDEKDKAFEYNQNMPYQMKVAALRDRIKYNQEMMLKGVEMQAAQDNQAMSTIGNMFGGMMCDATTKQDVIDIDDAINRILRLRPVDFKYIDDPDKNHHGFIAQELQNVIPEAVKPMQGFLIVDNNELVALLVKSIQQQQTQIKLLTEKINQLSEQ